LSAIEAPIVPKPMNPTRMMNHLFVNQKFKRVIVCAEIMSGGTSQRPLATSAFQNEKFVISKAT
jgi:hypothetical protein